MPADNKNTLCIAEQRHQDGRRTAPTRLRPLAAALVLALNGTTMSSLPTLGAVAAGGFLITVARDARADCVLSAPFVNYTCTGSSAVTLGGRLDGTFALIIPIDTYSINSGSAQANMAITTSGNGAAGIVADARGTPSDVVFEKIPVGNGGSSAPVLVNNFANITTHGDNAAGIIAQSQAGGIPVSVIPAWKALLTEKLFLHNAYLVTQVEGQTSNVGTPVTGNSLVNIGGVLTRANGGTFTIDVNGGAPVFDPGHDFDDLAIGESRTSVVSYGLTNIFAAISPFLPSSMASLVATVTKTGAGFTTVFGINFAQYGTSPQTLAQTSLLPDVSGYLTRYFENEALGGAANTVTVNSAGTIDTFGQSSHGLFAQSKGGRGRDGNDSLGNGDPGQAGQAGGVVNITNNSVITTRGLSANGIVARSIGNNGGTGGDSDIAGSGGAGGGGGAGGEVTVDNNSDIVTRGAFSTAIIAQSLGGSAGEGGDGGWIYGPAGGGGASGFGGHVLVDNSGNITTTGPKSLGIFAQSVGGFAGSGGDASGFFAFGADGGSSGRGGDVNIINSGVIRTTAEAIFAQSIGGGGGNAGTGNGLIFTGGGDGKRGGDGGIITITNSGQLETSQASAMGIFAQSVGGGGGNGADGVSFSLFGGQSLGGNGDAAGNGGRINVDNNNASISTQGDFAHGIYGLSVGGGGGFAGNAQTITAGSAFALALSSGGNGASGGYGGTVTINSSGDILTAGSQAFGIGAQSIGGGGGGGGSAVSIAVAVPPPDGAPEGTPTVSVAIAMGGRGSSGGNGGTVNIGAFADQVTGTIETSGFRSYGILAQSVGGGGGDGGFSTAGAITLDGDLKFAISLGGDAGAGGNGGLVNVHSASTTSTTGDFAYGILAQSIGGGGGSGGSSVALTFDPVPQTTAAPDPNEPPDLTTLSLAMGGVGGAGGVGNAVLIDGNGGSIHTQGAFAHGILAQSIGGGGGAGGNTISSDLGLFFNTDTMRTSLGLGGWSTPGAGAYGQNGGTVTINIEADIETEKNFSNGILAQSIGGGGGAGGVSFNTDLGTLMSNGIIDGQLFPELNNPGGGAVKRSGNGSTVRVESTGDIITRGDFSYGILAQSIGGGGGTGGINISDPTRADSVNLSGSFGTIRGDSGMMFAGTTGGVGSGGAVTVIHDGNITASGANSHGIFAQSAGSSSNISVTINNGTVQGGSGASAGISIHDGLNNALTILGNGTVTTLNALSIPSYSSAGYGPFAILGTGGNETVNNYGAVIGNVNLGSGSNAFNNKLGGTFVSGPSVMIGGTLTNDGTISPGGLGNVFSTAVSGSLVQGSTGVLTLDLDFATDTADRIQVTGAANLAGSVAVNPLNSELITAGNRQVTIVSGGTVGDISNLSLSFAPSAAVSYQLLKPSPNSVALSYSVDFAPSQGLGGNQSAVGNYVNAILQAGGSPAFTPILLTLLALPDDASLARAYDQLSPEPLLATTTTAVMSDLRFSDALHSCRVREGEFRFVSEGECSWVRLIGSKLDQDRTDTTPGFNRKTNTLAAGAQKRVNQNWSAGFGFSIDTSTLHVADNTRSEGNQYALGVIAKRNLGADAFTASLNLGYGPYDTTRLVDLTGPAIAASKQNVGLASAHVRWSRDFEHKNVWYLRPLLDVGVTQVYHGAFDEQGAGAANLSARSGRNTLVSLQPGVEFGREFATAGGTLIRPFGMVGLTHFVSGTTTGITASLQGAPVGTAPFTTESTMDNTYADLTLGMDALGTNGAVFRISYSGQFSGHTESHSASLKAAIPF